MSADNSPPPPYSPNDDRSTEIKAYATHAKQLKDDFGSLNEYAQNLAKRADDFDSTHRTEISSIEGKSRSLRDAYDAYLRDVVRSGATTLMGLVQEFNTIIALLIKTMPLADQIIEIDGFIKILPEKFETSLERLNQIQILKPKTLELSIAYLNLISVLMDEKNTSIASAKAEISEKKAAIDKLKEELRTLPSPSKGIMNRFDSSEARRKQIDTQVARLKQEIIKLDGDITAVDEIIDAWSSTPSEFNKLSDSAGAAIEKVPENLRSTMIKVFVQMKMDACGFRYALDHLPINMDHVNDAENQWKIVYNALRPLTVV
ncbi:hypothetical protein FIBSPDRAFT_875324 [Athelia psychrophila]|uniref:Uncharacterized protein n=1 Tax=Athelia psychrophila TaxID=1759441 RepID=A0A165WF22_9AGAM|nr:hypothetical protein FIBSPDRAFT_875324 [Fibularhizoctonia sp. CBS 109695]